MYNQRADVLLSGVGAVAGTDFNVVAGIVVSVAVGWIGIG